MHEQRHDPAGRALGSGVERVHVGIVVCVRPVAPRLACLRPHLLDRILESRQDEVARHPQARRQGVGEGVHLGVGRRGVRGQRRLAPRIGEQRLVLPQGDAVGAPHERHLPAGERLARVPLALAVLDEPGRSPPLAQQPGQPGGQLALLGPVGGGLPLGGGRVAGRHERGLAAHRQADVGVGESRVDSGAERADARPLVVGVGLGDAHVLVDAGDGVLERELDAHHSRRAGDRGRTARVGCRRERDVAFAREESTGGVEADPAGARNVDLGPGVQIGEVLLGAGGAVDGLEVGRELHEVARHEAGREAEAAQDRHEEPGRVAAGAERAVEGLPGGLHAGLQPDGVRHVAVHRGVDGHEEVDDARVAAGDAQGRDAAFDPGVHEIGGVTGGVRALGHVAQVGGEVLAQPARVREGERLRVLLDEEVERVDDRHVGHQVDGDRQMVGRLGEDEAREVIAEGVLLPVDEVVRRGHRQRVRLDRRPAVRRRPQPHRVWVDRHRRIEGVLGRMVEGHADRHGAQPRGSPAGAGPPPCYG